MAELVAENKGVEVATQLEEEQQNPLDEFIKAAQRLRNDASIPPDLVIAIDGDKVYLCVDEGSALKRLTCIYRLTRLEPQP